MTGQVAARQVVLGLGSNIGDSAAILQGAVNDLVSTPGVDVTAVSAVFETDPVGGPEQPVYLNAVLLAQSALLSHEILAVAQGVEQHWLRTREMHWGPRTLDVDIVAIEGETHDDPDLTVPHRLAHERAFVLVPWYDVDPGAVVEGRGRVADLLVGMDTSGVRPTTVHLVVPTAEPGV
jgi:2-amino-4-hydroxy-6-hydroxymethyldihydropteridine diphosphokinase